MSAAAIPVLITRAEPGASEAAQRIEALGLRALKSPVLAIQQRPDERLPDLQSLSGLVFTSANGVRAFADRSDDRNLATWCVGPATATAAREAGFATVHESVGNAVDLAEYIVRNSASSRASSRAPSSAPSSASSSAPSSVPLLHVANHAAKGDLKRILEAHGFRVEFSPLYEMRVVESVSNEATQALAGNGPTIVLIHSAKGAEAFVQLCADKRIQNLTIVAISETAAQPLSALSPEAVHVATAPNEDGLFAALASVIATLSA